MADKEKVIKEAEQVLSFVLPDEKDTSGIMVRVGWIRDILALLKEQEAELLQQEAELDILRNICKQKHKQTCGEVGMRLIDAYALQDEIHKSKMKNPHKDAKVAKNHDFEHEHFMWMVTLQPTVQEEIV